ncbi:MAG: hypothetical protein WA832_07225 [Bradyrhizobium sp.]|uniref:hypothetical protein n=1 Tax=Bradyrhizobium sp. TaxID=376 RepID=UPI003C52839F
MMTRSRWFRWAVRIVLGGVALLGGGLAVLFIINPGATIILFTMLVFPLFGNTKPPSLFEADIAGMWTKWYEAGRKITAHLQQQFPAGTTEATLKSALTRQGFKPLPPPPADCVPSGVQIPIGKIYTSCPTRDPSKTLVYEWSGGVCTSTVSVRWETDVGETITQVNGNYYAACL